MSTKPRRRSNDQSWLKRTVDETSPRLIVALIVVALGAAADYVHDQHVKLDDAARAGAANAEAIRQLQLDVTRLQGGRKP